MKKYTFDDWLNFKIHEYDYDGSTIINDSGKYLKFINENKMTFETLNKIQEAQAMAYQKIIDYTIEKWLKVKNKRLIKHTPDIKRKIEADIRHVEKFLSDHQEIYDDVIYPVLHRRIKNGATFITAAQYRKVVLNNEGIIAHFQTTNNPKCKNIWIDVPFSHEWIYCLVEVAFLWLKFLENELNNLPSKQPAGPDIEQPNTKRLKNELKKYGFYDLTKVSELRENSDKLIQLLSDNELPYQIAMLYYLGFLKHLEKEYCNKS